MTLQALIAEILATDLADVPMDRPLGEAGIDSLTAAEISVAVEREFGVVIPLTRFLGDETLEELDRELRVEAQP